MTDLEALRDDGPLARRAARFLRGRSEPGPLAWLGPPLRRTAEYGGVVALAASTEPDALPACFAFLTAVAFHHYDVLYGVRSGRGLSPSWISTVGGGWELRLAVAGGLAALGVLEPGLIAGAIVLGTVFIGESAARWVRQGREGRPWAAQHETGDALE